MGTVGIDPDEYWRYTLRELDYKSKSFETDLVKHQMLEHAIYDVQFGFNGKKIFKQDWLKKRFPLLYRTNEKPLSGDSANAANAALMASGLVKKIIINGTTREVTV